MQQVSVALVKAFTKDKEAGNPAGVVINSKELNAEQMQTIAAELNFSESAFVSPSEVADFRVRFFSPTQEVDFCGHATIATFHALAEQGKIPFKNGETEKKVTQETNIGVLPVFCEALGKITMVQSAPVFGTIERDRVAIAKLLGVEVGALLDQPLQVVSTGTPKLMIPVNSLATLQAITPDLPGIAAYCKKSEARGFYPFTAETNDPRATFQARQLNPAAGIDEDPLTGVAAGALGCYAKRYGLTTSDQTIVEQGFTIHMGGQMFVDVSKEVRVGGYAVAFGQREINV